jgi:hypothetical protein
VGSPGADDNGSGTAAVTEAARLFAGEHFEATIVYIAFGGEEQGLIGSEAWARWARGRSLDIRGVINLDMIGYLPQGWKGDLDIITEPLSYDLRDLAYEAAELYLPEYPVIESILSGGNSDQQSFWDHGYPALLFHEDTGYRNPHYHSPRDVIGQGLNDFAFMRNNVQVAVALLATLARPLRVRVDHVPLLDPSADDAWYEILASVESTAPLLEDSILVRYSVNDGPLESLEMEATGDSSFYRAWIPRQDAGSVIEYEIVARDIEGRKTHHPSGAPEVMHRFIVGLTTSFSEDFEADQGWSVGAAGDSATHGLWERAEPVGTGAQPGEDADPEPGGTCFVTGNGEPGGEIGAEDVDGGRTTLISPRIDLSGAIGFQIDYWWWFVDETYFDDTLRVSLSHDDGQSWYLLEEIGRSERKWNFTRVTQLASDLPLTAAMRMRFVVEDRGQPSLVEAAIDRITIRAIIPGSGMPPVAQRSRLTKAWPLPFREGVTIGYDLLMESEVRLRVYDLRGRLTAELPSGPSRVGPHTIPWDGRDARGEPVPSGLYFVRLEIPGSPTTTLRIPRVR